MDGFTQCRYDAGNGMTEWFGSQSTLGWDVSSHWQLVVSTVIPYDRHQPGTLQLRPRLILLVEILQARYFVLSSLSLFLFVLFFLLVFF
jgi:hypothetical protein